MEKMALQDPRSKVLPEANNRRPCKGFVRSQEHTSRRPNFPWNKFNLERIGLIMSQIVL